MNDDNVVFLSIGLIIGMISGIILTFSVIVIQYNM
jgi:hypothetical protein